MVAIYRCRPRSIPACAGEPLRGWCQNSLIKVYPRVCGGTRGRLAQSSPDRGLSPRVRGNRGQAGADFFRHGSIPACAGEPSIISTFHVSGGVYPRVCGGTFHLRTRLFVDRGLSPRVRGNRQDTVDQPGQPRSIPACAGEPRRRASPSPDSTVYPRVCGGTSVSLVNTFDFSGLSPRVRGNRARLGVGVLFERSIPACAGEPVRARLYLAGQGVYPRVCGGTILCAILSPYGQGLSPRVRGNPDRAVNVNGTTGSIPACAGEPNLSFR